MPGDLDRLRALRDSAGLFLDFDGTLAEIVARPEDAEAVPGAAEALRALVPAFALVAVVSGRPAAQVQQRLAVPGVEVFGLYGLERLAEDEGSVRRLLPDLRRIEAAIAGVRLEDKGATAAMHYRGAADPDSAGRQVAAALGELAARHGLLAVPGKMVVELTPAGLPGKGAVVEAACRERKLLACLYAGDDRADLDGFAALDRLATAGVHATKLAVRTEETPPELLGRADLVVERPAGLVALLGSLLG